MASIASAVRAAVAALDADRPQAPPTSNASKSIADNGRASPSPVKLVASSPAVKAEAPATIANAQPAQAQPVQVQPAQAQSVRAQSAQALGRQPVNTAEAATDSRVIVKAASQSSAAATEQITRPDFVIESAEVMAKPVPAPVEAKIAKPEIKAPLAESDSAATVAASNTDDAKPSRDAVPADAHAAKPATIPASTVVNATGPQHAAAQTTVAPQPLAHATTSAATATPATPVVSSTVPQPVTPERADAPLRLPAQGPASHEDAPEIEALALRIAAKGAAGARRFDIRLDPPELGRIDVRLDVNTDGRAQAQLSADKPQTLDLLQRDHRTLERALKDAGLDLGSMSFSLKGDERRSAPNEPHNGRNDNHCIAAASNTVSAPPPAARWSMNGDARVDIRV